MTNSNSQNSNQNDPREKVGSSFDPEAFHRAQKRGWDALYSVAKQIKPGMVEADAKKLLKGILDNMEADMAWHPPQVRFGVNTVLPYGRPQIANHVLTENDLFFLDLGPVFNGYESDIGETFQIGSDPHIRRLITDSKSIFEQVKKQWQTTGMNGEKLYQYGLGLAKDRGWEFALEGASGHRISEFPHSAHYRGKLTTYELVPTPDRWILEIHLIDKQRGIGAFYEDVL
jgi:Xaa-Pro aminopeptidase